MDFFKNINISNILSLIFLFIIISYLWFKVSAIEKTVLILEQKMNSENKCSIPANHNQTHYKNFEMDNIIMNEVFSYCNNNPIELPIAEHVKIEEADVEPEPEIENKVIFDLKKEDVVDNVSTVSLTKKKLSKLNLDSLKQKCTELNLQTEGTKNELIERILNNE